MFHRACKELAKAGYEVHLIAVGAGAKPYMKQGVTIHPLPECTSRRLRYTRTRMVAKMATDIQPDLFHVHEPDLLGPVLGEAGSRPVIYDVHESYLDILSESTWLPGWGRPLVRFLWDHWEQRLVQRCAGVIAVTEPIAQRYARLNRNVQVVANYPNWPDDSLREPVERESVTCVMAGSITPSRGLSQIFRALTILKTRGSDIRLALAGTVLSESYLLSLLDEAERLGIRQQVEYHGALSQKEAMLFQQQADIGLVIYLPFGNCKVGLPSKLVECMALGLPVVCSDFPVYREVAGLRGAGILVDPSKPEQIADAIESLVRNPGLARMMGEAGRRAVRERFNWNEERKKLLEVYQQILGSSAFGKLLPSNNGYQTVHQPSLENVP